MGIKPADPWAKFGLVQGIMALASLAAIIYLAVTAQDVPEVLVSTVSVIIGFYFGQKTLFNRTNRARPPGGN